MPIKDADKNREYKRLWAKKRRQEGIARLGGKCVVCSSTERLEVDHIDPSTKSMNPREIWGRNETDRNAELDKCQVLCYQCHKDKTSRERTKPLVHGEYNCYKKGCRCSLCREANNVRLRRQRKREVND